MAEPFEPLYGEPNWEYRPYVRRDYPETVMPHFKNSSYEENRLRAMTLRPALDADLSKLSALSISEWGTVRQRPNANVSAARQRTYLRWCQTPLIEYLIGPEATSFPLPGDLITRRSFVFFAAMMNTESEEAQTRIIRLPEISPDTFEHIYVWLMSPSPSLDTEMSTSLIVDIAIFATNHQIPTLLNQTIYALWIQFSSSRSLWQPDLLDRIYKHTTVDDLLRVFTRASLSYINGPNGYLFPSTFPVEDWEDVFKEHPGLGFDYFVTMQRGVTTVELVQQGPCHFHDHIQQGDDARDLEASLCLQRQEDECFEDVNAFKARLLIHDAAQEIDDNSSEAILVIQDAPYEHEKANESSDAIQVLEKADESSDATQEFEKANQSSKATQELEKTNESPDTTQELEKANESSDATQEPEKANESSDATHETEKAKEPPESVAPPRYSHRKFAVPKPRITSRKASQAVDSDIPDELLGRKRKDREPHIARG